MQVDIELRDGQSLSYVGASAVKEVGTKVVIYGDAGIIMVDFEKKDVKSIKTQ